MARINLSGLSRDHVMKALMDLDNGIDHPFGSPRGWILVHDGKEYAPKAVAGVASRHLYGRMPTKRNQIHGGEQTGSANPVLRELGFRIVPKGEHIPRQIKPKDRIRVSKAVDLAEPPERKDVTVSRFVRNSALVQEIKVKHGHRCQLCNTALKLGDGGLYCEAHHLQPLGGEHSGPDIQDNIIVVCPNHHAFLDFGAIELDEESIQRQNLHGPSQKFIRYHNERVVRG